MTSGRMTESLHARDAAADGRAASKSPHKPKPEVYNTEIPVVRPFTVEESWTITNNVTRACPDGAAYVVETLLGY